MLEPPQLRVFYTPCLVVSLGQLVCNKSSWEPRVYEVPDEAQKLVGGYSKAGLPLASHELLDNEKGGLTMQ